MSPAVRADHGTDGSRLMRLVLNVVGGEVGFQGAPDAPAAASAHDKIAGMELGPLAPTFRVGGHLVDQDQIRQELERLKHLGIQEV